jgi:hypothetical protein
MSWESVSAVSEVVAAVAVVVSLVYIAAQVRSGAEAFRTSVRDSSFTALMEFNYAMLADDELAWIFQTGTKDLSVLNEQQQARALHAIYAFFKLFENMYLHYLAGSVDDSVWKNNSKVLFAYGALPGAQRYLNDRMPIYEPRYQELLKTIAPKAARPGEVLPGLYEVETQS